MPAPENNSPKIKQACAGLDHSAAVTSNGNLWVWGDNAHGQLGLGDLAERTYPAAIEYPFSNNNVYIDRVYCGTHATVAVSTKGNVFAWGRNNFGQLGVLHGDSARVV